MFDNIWNNIVSWFKDLSERNRLINSFNNSARDAYVCGDAPAMLQASISRGNSNYKHDFSKWFSSGFRIKVFCGRQLTKEEIVFIGMSILSNQQLLRRLVVLGWDTLEIHGDKGAYGCQWKITDHLDKINLIGNYKSGYEE